MGYCVGGAPPGPGGCNERYKLVPFHFHLYTLDNLTYPLKCANMANSHLVILNLMFSLI
jgi:hypothetical protein